MSVISLRLENSELKRIDNLSIQEHKGRSTIARELIQQAGSFECSNSIGMGKYPWKHWQGH